MGFLFLSVNRKPSIFIKLLLYHKCLEIQSCTACTLPAAWWTRGHFCGGNAACFWITTAGCSQNLSLPHRCLLRWGAHNPKPYFLLGKLTCGVKASGKWHSSLHASANLASGVNYCGVRKCLCSQAMTQIKDKASLYTLLLLSLRKVKYCLQQTLQRHHYSLSQCHGDFPCHFVREAFSSLRCKTATTSVIWNVIRSSFPHMGTFLSF